MIDADLQQVRRSIQQHTGGSGSRERSGGKQFAEPEEGESFAELQRKWS